jgi:hypothetical protein
MPSQAQMITALDAAFEAHVGRLVETLAVGFMGTPAQADQARQAFRSGLAVALRTYAAAYADIEACQ